MAKVDKFSITARIKSFRYASEGLKTLLKEEHNARVHLVAAILAIGLGFALGLSTSEWVLLIFAIGFVICTEALNSAIECLCDFVSPTKHDVIKKTKDLAAAAVLISAITAFTVGLILFLPKIFF